VTKRVDDLFEVRSGDFHAVKELDSGSVPLISCGDANNGLVGYFDVPDEYVYRRCVTVAYNGSWPLMAKYHPYQFGAKDDVAVLIPRKDMQDTTLLYIAALLNRMTWRHSYGRKCFREKLENVLLSVPVADGSGEVDEGAIAKLFPKDFEQFVPERSGEGVTNVPQLRWRSFNLTDLFDLERGDFHSLTALAEGEFTTVSRIAIDNGVVGAFERPDGAHVYGRGHITVSTVGGDAFVQLEDFIVTDNVIVLVPKSKLLLPTLFFIAFILNRQKWRYGYGRQPYIAKLERVKIQLPVTPDDQLDEDAIESIVKQASYWQQVEKRFEGVELPKPGSRRRAQDALPGF
jgi:hypothetical protein